MATNPLYNTNDSPNGNTQPTKAVNKQGVYVARTHNKFDNSYFNYTTQMFGIYQPFFAMEAVAGDNIPLSSSHNVRSLPMSSPFLSSLTLHKDYFMVPYQAILPNTWEYIFKNPTQGDDVPVDANCVMRFAYWNDGSRCFIDNLLRFSLNSSISLQQKFRNLFILELFLSSGSLLQQLGFHLNPKFTLNDGSIVSFDTWFDGVIRSLVSLNGRVLVDDVNFIDIVYRREDSDVSNVTLSQICNLMRHYGSRFQLGAVFFDTASVYAQKFTFSGLPVVNADNEDVYLNISRLLAYQLSCAQYFVNPQVDFIYNSQLYRDNIYTLWKTLMDDIEYPSDVKTFTMNGIVIPYDFTSGVYLDEVSRAIFQDDFVVESLYDYLYSIFGHHESLKFGDYFTDSRTRPLALGDNYVGVDVNGVDVIDMSKSIIYQRFRNAVVKLGNNFGDYLRGIFGSDPSPDYHYPKYIVHGEFDVNGFEVANTTDIEQGNLVTNLRSGDDTFAFEVHCDMPCILLGISSFSVPRAYMQTKERFFFHKDRFDMFNPMLQYIGDQPVYNIERTDLRPNDEIFGYQSRNNEYKQRYSIVSGAFASTLPAWTFVSDSLFNPVDDITIVHTQCPEYLRAHSYEFDRFFSRMSGYSMANGFHFIVVYNNKCESVRPMEVNPSTL